MDLTAVKQAIDLVRKNRQDDATSLEGTIADPLARKLVEWVILRSDNGTNDFSRYAAFIAANPSWPSVATLRRRAEGVLWQERVDPQTVIGFFATEPPHTVKGHFALARALLAQGDRNGAAAAIRETWRTDGFTADLEAQARDAFAGLITPADDAARMDARLYAEDDDAGLSAANISTPRRSQSPRRVSPSSTRRIMPNRCSKPYRKPRATTPAICSAASNGCGVPTKSPRPRNG